MTGEQSTRRARVETTHDDDSVARALARTLQPDNTTEMETTADGRRVVTTITRETTGSLHSTLDDYVVNLQVAAQLSTHDAGASTADAGASQTTHDNE